MKKLCLFTLAALTLFGTIPSAQALRPRIVFEKYLWAEGDDPKARFLDQLMVKFYDEDMVRLRNGQFVSLNGARSLAYTNDFLARHPEIRADVIIKSETEEEHLARLARVEAQSGKDLVDMFSFYCFHLPVAASDPKALLADILGAPEVETAYYEPIPKDMTCTDIGNNTPNYFASQNHFDAAPLGVDLLYIRSTYVDDVVHGEPGTWVGIFERGVDEGHEDYTSIDIITGGAGDSDNDHGCAVSGIVGACRDNDGAAINAGMIGFAADHTIKVFQRNSPNYASTADVYNFANTQLLPGEVTTSSWGPSCSPCPAGQACPCNPGQNGSVCCEYTPSVKAEIDAGTADGIIYCLSAGNGCVDLDDPIFGSTFDFATGSIYCAAINSTGDHDASCFTTFGSRCTSNAWGDGVYSLGYGDLFVGAGTDEEWYTDTFGGTSAAGPIVAGCAAVLNNLYRDLNPGSNFSPTTMRALLDNNGTPPGNVTPGPIGVFPNLRGIVLPDLNADQRSGWTNVIVPRNTDDASGASAVLPANLNSAPSNTYWNASIENSSYFQTATPGRFRLHRDDVTVVTWSYASMAPLFRGYGINWSSDTRGGRHTSRCESDPDDEVVEGAEAGDPPIEQQNWVQQHVWDPRDLTAETPLVFTQPPLRLVTGQTGIFYNCDGYSLTTSFGGFWDLLGCVASTTLADYDARIYSEAITSTNGFDTYEAWSSFVGPIDIVGKNGNFAGAVSGAAVINWDGEDDSYFVEGETSTYIGTPGIGRNDAGTFTIDTDEIMEAIEFNVNELVDYNIEVDVTAGNANLVISVFGPDDVYFALGNRNVTANANGAGGDEMISCWTPAETGFHLALIHKYNSSDYGETATFTAYIGKAGFDLTHNLNTGWSHEIVIRQAGGLGVPAVLPASLTGNATINYFNAGYINQGCNTSLAGINDAFIIDGPTVLTTGNWAAHAPGATTQWLNQGPVFVFGGRHLAGDIIDVNNEGAEWREDNNRHDEQFVWTPFAMGNQSIYLTTNPGPNFRNFESSELFANWNQDGWRFTGNTHWSGVAEMPTDVDDDYVMALYSPSTGSENGFGAYHVPSFSSTEGALDFVVENGNLNGAVSYDVGVTNNWGWPTVTSDGGYRMYQCNSIQDLTMDALNGPFTLSTNHLIHVYDLIMTSGVQKRIILDNQSANDLGLAIFDPTDSYGSRTNNGTVTNAGGDGADETVMFTPTATGRHGIVVFKNDLSDVGSSTYRLIIGDRIPAVPQRLVIQTLNSQVDPISMRAHWDSVTTDANGAPMNVDNYRLYYTLDPNLVGFPAGWVAYIITDQATQNFGVAVSVGYFRMVVVAQDSDGLILSHSPLPDGSDITGTRLEIDASAFPPQDGPLPILGADSQRRE